MTWSQELTIALAWAGQAAVLARECAAALWGFDGFPPGPVEVLVPRSGRGRRPGPARVHTTTELRPIDRAVVAGFPVTSASRTVIDLAATAIDADRLGNAIDSAVRDGHTSPAFLRRRIQSLRGPGRRGVRRLDELMLDAGGHSHLERRFLELVRAAGLPRPRCQVIHRRDGRTVARVDFEFVPYPLVVEVSGRRGHVTEVDRLRDARRRNELQLEGMIVLELLTAQVLDAPESAVAEIRRALRSLGAAV